MLVIMFMINKIMGLEGYIKPPPPTVIDDYTKRKCLNMQLGNLRPQRNIETNYKQYDERYK